MISDLINPANQGIMKRSINQSRISDESYLCLVQKYVQRFKYCNNAMNWLLCHWGQRWTHSQFQPMREQQTIQPANHRPINWLDAHPCRWQETRVATKIFEGFGEALLNGFIIDREPASIIHYTRPGTCINQHLH